MRLNLSMKVIALEGRRLLGLLKLIRRGLGVGAKTKVVIGDSCVTNGS